MPWTFRQGLFKEIPLNGSDKTGSRRKWGICIYISTCCSGHNAVQCPISVIEVKWFVNFLYSPFREPLRLGGYAACYSDFRATSGSENIKPGIAQNVKSGILQMFGSPLRRFFSPEPLFITYFFI